MIRHVMIQSLVGLAMMVVLLFVPAGTFGWPGGWAYLTEISIASLVITRWL